MANNKVQLADGTTLIDLTSTTATSDKILQGYGAFGANGEWMNGSAVTGSGSAVTVTETLDANGGTIYEISAVSLDGDTVSPSTLLSGYTAHNALGQAITGTYVAPAGEPDCPVFEILNDSSGNQISATCNMTFSECVALISSSTDYVIAAIVRESGEEGEDVPDSWEHACNCGHYVSSGSGLSYLKYYGTGGQGVPVFQLTYYSDGTIVSGNDNIEGLVTLTATQNGTYGNYPTSVYKEVVVNVPTPTPNLQAKTNINPSTSSQTITADSNYDGLSSVQINAMPSGTAGTPSATKGAVSNHSVSVTPSVTNTTGYITGSTKTGTAVTVSASELVSGSETKTANGTYDVTNLSELVVNVPTGSAKNVQVYFGYASRTANSYGATDVTLTVAKTGTYKISWCAWRGSSSGTMGTNLHIGSNTGTNQQTWTGTYGQIITLENQSLTKDTVLTLYATSGSNSRTVYVGNLIIEEQ